MQEQAMYHKPETQYAYALSENSVALRLRTAKEDTPEVSVLYGGKYDFARKRREKAMRLCCSDRLFNYYTAELELSDVRLVYVFRIRERRKTYYYSEDGLSEHFAFDLSYYNAFQIAYLNAADIHRPVQWMQDARFYQIFIDRFFRGNQEKDDSYITLPWGELPTPKSFAGGDLKGITKKLPYLHELGVNALYLTPVFESVSNHKYDTQDYFAIDEMFGGEKDFRKFMKAAHEAGFHVVLDAVFNHVSERCLQFRDVLQNGKASRSFDFWRKFRAAVKAENGACVIIGENWHDANPYLRGDQYDSIMNYAFTKACLDAFAFGTLDATGFAEKLNELLMRNTDTVNGMMLNLLDSHDTHRFLTQVGGDIQKLGCALAVLYLFVGAPCIYYGTEIGMEGGYDPDCRRTMDWARAEERPPLWRLVQQLAACKRESAALHGTKAKIWAEGDLFFLERGETNKLRLTVNFGKAQPLTDRFILTNAESILNQYTFMIEKIGEG